MTYTETALLPLPFGSALIKVNRAHGHPLQPIDSASTFVVVGLRSEEDVVVFVKETFGLAEIGLIFTVTVEHNC
jgi:hypothetical protein